jgi:hypothetical protein
MRQALGSAAPLGSFRMSTCGSTRRLFYQLTRRAVHSTLRRHTPPSSEENEQFNNCTFTLLKRPVITCYIYHPSTRLHSYLAPSRPFRDTYKYFQTTIQSHQNFAHAYSYITLFLPNFSSHIIQHRPSVVQPRPRALSPRRHISAFVPRLGSMPELLSFMLPNKRLRLNLVNF